MANVCNPPYFNGTGGFCNCNCKCIPPYPCYLDYSWTYTVTRGMPCEDGTQAFTSDLSIDGGCCLQLISSSTSGFPLKSWQFTAIGAGTISITNAYNEVSTFCSNAALTGMKFGINSYYLYGPGTLTYEANNAEAITITLVLDVNSCCGYILNSFDGNIYTGACAEPAPFLRSRKINLKNQILSRIKKVRYKP